MYLCKATQGDDSNAECWRSMTACPRRPSATGAERRRWALALMRCGYPGDTGTESVSKRQGRNTATSWREPYASANRGILLGNFISHGTT